MQAVFRYRYMSYYISTQAITERYIKIKGTNLFYFFNCVLKKIKLKTK